MSESHIVVFYDEASSLPYAVAPDRSSVSHGGAVAYIKDANHDQVLRAPLGGLFEANPARWED